MYVTIHYSLKVIYHSLFIKDYFRKNDSKFDLIIVNLIQLLNSKYSTSNLLFSYENRKFVNSRTKNTNKQSNIKRDWLFIN